MELELTDKEAQKFITIIKKILKKYNIEKDIDSAGNEIETATHIVEVEV